MVLPWEGELLGRGNDVQSSIQDLQDLILEKLEVRACRVQHQICLDPSQDVSQMLHHDKAQGMAKADDFTDVLANLVRGNIHTTNQLQSSAFHHVPCYSTTDGAEPVLNHSNSVRHV